MQPPANVIITSEPTAGPAALSPAASPAAEASESAGLSWASALNVVLDADKKHFQKAVASFREKKGKGSKAGLIPLFLFLVVQRFSPDLLDCRKRAM